MATTTTSSSAILRELHRLHRFARELQEQIDRGPRQLKAHEDRIARQDQARTEVQEALKKLKVAIHDKEVGLKAKHQQIAKYEQQRNQAANRKEYDAFQHEIEHTKQECKLLEDEILDVMEKAETRAAQLPELEKDVTTAKEELARFKKEHEPRLEALRGERDKAIAQLKEQEQMLPSAMRETYDRLVATQREDALSLVMNRTCSACYTEITVQNLNDLHAGRLVLCKSCGRLLYVDSVPAPEQ